MNDTGLKLRLLKLHCYQQDESDGDEVYLLVNDNRVWPLESKYIKIVESSIDLNVTIEARENMKIELWDHDVFSPDDKLGVFSMLVDEKGGPFITDMGSKSSDKAKYSLEWEVL